MKINKLTIENFRGIHRTKSFLLKEKFVLLSAQNGMGKTTVIDAIEWALTGTIGRLRDAYKTRSTNQAERMNADNLSGILKNKNTSKSGIVRVELEFQVGSQVFIIQRTQTSDVLDSKKSKLNILQGDETTCRQLLSEINPNFYAHHFCDIQKSVNMQATKRENFVEMFDEFISDYSNEETIAKNLNLFANDTERYITDIDYRLREITPKIEASQGMLEQLQKESAVFQYPDTPVYKGEQINSQQMSEAELRIQLQQLYDCGYTRALEILEPIKQHEVHCKIVSQLSLLKKILETQKAQIDEAVHLSEAFGSLAQSISKCEDLIRKYKKINLTRENLGLHSVEIIAIGSTEFTQEFYHQKQEEATAIDNQINELHIDIRALTQGNQILDALTSLLGTHDGLIAYKNQQYSEKGYAKCPVCGSELFGKLEDNQILSEVQSYTNQNKNIIAGKKEKILELQQAKNLIRDELLQAAKTVLDNNIHQLTDQFQKRTELKEETDAFFKCVQILCGSEPGFSLSRWSEIDFVQKMTEKHSAFLISDAQILAEKSKCENILRHLDFQTDNSESAVALSTRITTSRQNLITLLPEFSVKYLSDKITSLKSQLKNTEILKQSERLAALTKEKNQLERRRHGLNALKDLAVLQASNITTTTSALKEKEYASVGPYLCLLYKKLARVNTIQAVNISHTNGKLSIIDEKGKNIINILSNGQLSVFTLSYFFAGLLARKGTEQCKVYFIDDLTACMDDVNMLAFLDLMKYQMLEEQAEHGSIDQLFFASCDYRVCELIRYKLKGSHIPFRDLDDNDFCSIT